MYILLNVKSNVSNLIEVHVQPHIHVIVQLLNVKSNVSNLIEVHVQPHVHVIVQR